MLREIRKKMVILHNRGPFRQEVKDRLAALEHREWIHMFLRLSGSRLTEEEIDTMMQGGFVLHAAVEECLLVDRVQQLREYIYRLTDMGAPLSGQILQDMHAILSGGGREEFRKGGILMERYGTYSQINGSDIADAINEVLRFAAQKTEGENSLEKAALIHNRILEIYPFSDRNELLSLAALYYMTAEAGYPLAALKLTEEAYTDLFLHYTKNRDCRAMAQALGEAVLARMDFMMQLTGHEI